MPLCNFFTSHAVKFAAPLALVSLVQLAGCASAPPPPPAPPPAPVATRPAVVLPIAQLDRGVQIVLPDTVLFQTGKADLVVGES